MEVLQEQQLQHKQRVLLSQSIPLQVVVVVGQQLGVVEQLQVLQVLALVQEHFLQLVGVEVQAQQLVQVQVELQEVVQMLQVQVVPVQLQQEQVQQEILQQSLP